MAGQTFVVRSGDTPNLGKPFEVIAANTTLTESQTRTTFLVTVADLVITLPSTKATLVYTFILANAALSAGTGLSISPVADDAIHGNGLTSVDNKDLILAGATDAEGDTVTIVGDGIDGWYITSAVGTWSKQA